MNCRQPCQKWSVLLSINLSPHTHTHTHTYLYMCTIFDFTSFWPSNYANIFIYWLWHFCVREIWFAILPLWLSSITILITTHCNKTYLHLCYCIPWLSPLIFKLLFSFPVPALRYAVPLFLSVLRWTIIYIYIYIYILVDLVNYIFINSSNSCLKIVV